MNNIRITLEDSDGQRFQKALKQMWLGLKSGQQT